MTKLNQIVAVTQGKKSQCEKAFTEIYKTLGKTELFSGISRTYKPLDEEGETQPKEEKFPQLKASDSILSAKNALTELFDVVATQDAANTLAKADIKVGDKVIVKDVPVTHLMFLEKQLVDVHTFVSKLPTLDASERWNYDSNVDCFATEVSETNRTVKKLRNHVLSEATDKHPAQVQVFNEDVKVGTWATKKFSGAIDVKTKNQYLANVKVLIEAVKFAREEANSMVVEDVKEAKNILDFIFT